MSLRVTSGIGGPISFDKPAAATRADDWSSRLAKLVPAEALGLYGAGSSFISALKPELQSLGLYFLTAGCLIFCIIVRYYGTRDSNGSPQVAAVLISVISFVLWILTLRPGPIDLGDYGPLAGLLALIWTSAITYFYKGDPQ